MGYSKNPNRYNDVQKLLKIVEKRGECIVQFQRHGQATNMAARINAFQRLMDTIETDLAFGNVICTRDETNSAILIVRPRSLDSMGAIILTEHDAEEVEPETINERQLHPKDALADLAALLEEEGGLGDE